MLGTEDEIRTMNMMNTLNIPKMWLENMMSDHYFIHVWVLLPNSLNGQGMLVQFL